MINSHLDICLSLNEMVNTWICKERNSDIGISLCACISLASFISFKRFTAHEECWFLDQYSCTDIIFIIVKSHIQYMLK